MMRINGDETIPGVDNRAVENWQGEIKNARVSLSYRIKLNF